MTRKASWGVIVAVVPGDIVGARVITGGADVVGGSEYGGGIVAWRGEMNALVALRESGEGQNNREAVEKRQGTH